MSSNFAEIENQAQQLDKMKESVPTESSPSPSASLQYKSQGMLKEEQKLKNMDPKKAEQMERLGMGFAGHRGYLIIVSSISFLFNAICCRLN